MEKGQRGFKEINISSGTIQHGEGRFSGRLAREPPKLANWRNNLTALSQFYNLYFVAYHEKIYVWRPSWPDQKCSGRPDLVIDVPRSKMLYPTHALDHRFPHAVNQLTVGELGDEEIIACVCDDGDVVAMWTREIMCVLEGTASLPLRPLLCENVDLSAWGIAIHKTARLIAVSSNTTEISIFAFALSENGESRGFSIEGPGDPDSLSLEYDPANPLHQWRYILDPDEWFTSDTFTNEELRSRRKNIKIILETHETNIPNIAFCNSGDDPNGEWLVSTDIHHKMKIWRIWTRKEVKEYDFRKNIVMRDPEMGWGVLCLDLRSFRLAQTVQEAFGCMPSAFRGCRDISRSRMEVRDSSVWHYDFHNEPALVDFGQDTEEEFSTEEFDDVDTEDDGEIEDPDEMVGGGPGALTNVSNLHQAGSVYYHHNQPASSSVTQDTASLLQLYSTNAHLGPLHAAYLAQTDHPREEADRDTQGNTDRSLSRVNTGTEEEAKSCPFAVLQTSQYEIRLFQHPLLCPSVYARRLLSQNIPVNVNHLREHDRMNLLAQIPELGILIVGSQVGRVALLTLTKVRKTDELAFRVELILPFQSQEAKKWRPPVPLAGIAVGPVQGHLKAPNSTADQNPRNHELTSRYRLMMTYLDNTVLSYEIARDELKELNVGPLLGV